MIISKIYKWYYNSQIQDFTKKYTDEKIKYATLFNHITYNEKIYTLALLIITENDNLYLYEKGLFSKLSMQVDNNDVQSHILEERVLGNLFILNYKTSSISCYYPEYGSFESCINFLSISKNAKQKINKKNSNIKQQIRFTKSFSVDILKKLISNFIIENKSLSILLVGLSAILPDYIKEDLFEEVGFSEDNIDIAKKVL